MEGGTLSFMLRTLRRRNYRLYFTGQTVSMIGSWMTEVATSWLVYRLTGSALMLGLIGFSGQIPAFLMSPFGGIFIDRWNKHRVLLVTQSLMMLQSLTLAGLALSGRITIGWLIALNAAEGIVNAFDMPCRQAFVVTLVENKADLPNAIALNSSIINLSRLVGPTLGALVIGAVGEGYCFLIDGLSFLGVLTALLSMKLAAAPAAHRQHRAALEQLREGVCYAFGFPPIRRIISLLALSCLVGAPYTVLVPIFAARVFHGGPRTLGLLMTASGSGALIGAGILAARRTIVGLGRVIPLAAGAFGCALMLFSQTRSIWLALPLLVVVGAGFMIQIACSNTIIQTIVDDDKRGRVMSFFMMAFLGTAPIGSLSAGWLADHIGARPTLFCGGAIVVAGAAWFFSGLPELRRHIRPIYVRMGLLPAIADGIAAASELEMTPEER